MSARVEKAVVLYQQTFNCSQAVFTAFRDETKLDEATALKLTTVFGAGVACTGASLCGAVSGALLAISMHNGRATVEDVAAKTKTYEMGKEFMKKFSEANASCDCEKLLGINIGTPENMEKAKQAGLFTGRCLELVRSASRILDGMI